MLIMTQIKNGASHISAGLSCPRFDIINMLDEDATTKICAPMVRYSKLAFRAFVRKYGTDIACTPMIISNAFIQSQKARDADFTTDTGDRPLIVQFAANKAEDFAAASCMVSPYCDGVDLNSGCPQRWAMQEGYGACMIDKPELIEDIIKQTKNRVTLYPFTVSVKIRIHEDIKQTVELCRRLEAAGASFVTVHGRTSKQRCQPVNTDALKLIKTSLSIPVVHNGDVTSLETMREMVEKTGVDGVMAARGILDNPAMFSGRSVDRFIVNDWVSTAMSYGVPFQCFHHHLMYMLEELMSKPERRIFNTLQSTPAVLDYLRVNYGIANVVSEYVPGCHGPPSAPDS